MGSLKPHFTQWCNRNHTSHKCWWIRTHWNLFPDATVSTSDCAKACPWANIQVIIQCQPDSVIISSLSPWSWGPNGQSVPFICTVPTPKIQIWILSLEEKNLFIQISFFCIFTFRPRNSKTFTSCLWWMLRWKDFTRQAGLLRTSIKALQMIKRLSRWMPPVKSKYPPKLKLLKLIVFLSESYVVWQSMSWPNPKKSTNLRQA